MMLPPPQNYLPSFKDLQQGLRAGRSVYEGYQRGWGLEHGGLRNEIRRDPDYIAAMQQAAGRSIVREDRLMNLFLLLKFFLPALPKGNIVEYGSYRGGSAFFMAEIARRYLPETKIFGLDTFAGMPQTDKGVDVHTRGDFADADFADLEKHRAQHGFSNLEFVRGIFYDTAPRVLAQAGKIALAHVDCDIYSAVKYTYEVTKPFMLPMGYWVFDDSTAPSCIGATEAVEEVVIGRDKLLSEQIYPHHVFRAVAA